jgi:hypothetical protein
LGPAASSQKPATSSQSVKPGYCGDGCIGNMHHQPIFEESADNRKRGRQVSNPREIKALARQVDTQLSMNRATKN